MLKSARQANRVEHCRRKRAYETSGKASGRIFRNSDGVVNDGAVILLAEDNPDDALLFRMALTKAGRTNPLQVVSNGKQALEYLKGEGLFADRTLSPMPQLLVLDLKMPELSGFEVLAWVRAQPGLKTLPVIVLTTSSYGPDVKQAYQMGANSFLTKPADFQEFVSAVRQMVEYWLDSCQIPPVFTPCPPWHEPPPIQRG